MMPLTDFTVYPYSPYRVSPQIVTTSDYSRRRCGGDGRHRRGRHQLHALPVVDRRGGRLPRGRRSKAEIDPEVVQAHGVAHQVHAPRAQPVLLLLRDADDDDAVRHAAADLRPLRHLPAGLDLLRHPRRPADRHVPRSWRPHHVLHRGLRLRPPHLPAVGLRKARRPRVREHDVCAREHGDIIAARRPRRLLALGRSRRLLRGIVPVLGAPVADVPHARRARVAHPPQDGVVLHGPMEDDHVCRLPPTLLDDEVHDDDDGAPRNSRRNSLGAQLVL